MTQLEEAAEKWADDINKNTQDFCQRYIATLAFKAAARHIYEEAQKKQFNHKGMLPYLFMRDLIKICEVGE